MAKAKLHYLVFQCYRFIQLFSVWLSGMCWSDGLVPMGFLLVSPVRIGKFTVTQKGEKPCGSYLIV